jgi:hypothetical protein
MSNERPEAEENLGLFLNPGGAASGGHYLVPMKPLTVGPGESGPEDEWHIPEETTDQTVAQDDTASHPPNPARKP